VFIGFWFHVVICFLHLTTQPTQAPSRILRLMWRCSCRQVACILQHVSKRDICCFHIFVFTSSFTSCFHIFFFTSLFCLFFTSLFFTSLFTHLCFSHLCFHIFVFTSLFCTFCFHILVFASFLFLTSCSRPCVLFHIFFFSRLVFDSCSHSYSPLCLHIFVCTSLFFTSCSHLYFWQLCFACFFQLIFHILLFKSCFYIHLFSHPIFTSLFFTSSFTSSFTSFFTCLLFVRVSSSGNGGIQIGGDVFWKGAGKQQRQSFLASAGLVLSLPCSSHFSASKWCVGRKWTDWIFLWLSVACVCARSKQRVVVVALRFARFVCWCVQKESRTNSRE
jgi:hypothetical protein